MPPYKRIVFFMTVVLAVAVTTAVSALKEGELSTAKNEAQKVSEEQQETEDDEIPAVDFDSPEPGDTYERAKRRERGAKYDNSAFVRKDDAASGAVESTFFSEWDLGLSAIPADKSDVVLIGEVAEAKAYLSNDKTGIYSEFTTRVEKLFKNSAPTPLAPEEVISLERQGGAVRHPTGRKYHYHVSGQNLPRRGRRYVFFLSAAEAGQSFVIITAYELKGGKVFPLDSPEQFQRYKGVDEAEFLRAAQRAVNSSNRD